MSVNREFKYTKNVQDSQKLMLNVNTVLQTKNKSIYVNYVVLK